MAKDTSSTSEVVASEQSNTEKKSVLKVFSRFKYPVKVPYNKDVIFIPPQGSVDLDPSLLEGELPSGLQSQVVEV